MKLRRIQESFAFDSFVEKNLLNEEHKNSRGLTATQLKLFNEGEKKSKSQVNQTKPQRQKTFIREIRSEKFLKNVNFFFFFQIFETKRDEEKKKC